MMGRDEGQTTVEWLGIAAVVVATVAALVAASPTMGGLVQEAVQRLVCLVTGGDCDGPRIGDPVALPFIEPQDGPLPFNLPDLPTLPGIDLPDIPDLPFGPQVPDLPDIPPIDLPDLNDAGDRLVEGLLESLVGPLGPFGDIAPYADEIVDFMPEVGSVVEELFGDTAAPLSDQIALAIAYALIQEGGEAETVHCGTSGSGTAVICVNNADDFVPAHADATTIGHVVFCETTCSPEILEHEMVHVDQFEEYGDQFIPLYIAESVQNGTCTGNRFEEPAYEVGGSCQD